MRRRHLFTLAAASAVASGCRPDAPPAAAPSAAPTAGLRFPDGFQWGASTSAYQIEGAADADGRGPSVWDTFAHQPGKTLNGDTGDTAADHYHRLYEDLDLMKGLGLRSYRFSISWSRVLPQGRGPINAKGLDFYHRLADGLLARNITPVATLFHWDTPQALQDKGGWEQRDCAQWFADYAQQMFYSLGDKVHTWLTLNEPKTLVAMGYGTGLHAPGKQNRKAGDVAGHHLLLGHGLAVRAFRSTNKQGRIGIALNLSPVYPSDASPAAAKQVVTVDEDENRRWLDPVLLSKYPAQWLAANSAARSAVRGDDLAVIGSRSDLLAVQYYNPVNVNARGERVTLHDVTQARWLEVYPTGLYDLLTRLRRDYGDIPLTITENGMPTTNDVQDDDRIAFLREHLTAAHRAVAEGVRLEGYHVWSLLDNFEWSEGYSQRWGLIRVDRQSLDRRRKASADWYQSVIARNGL